jgi:hypothetical protein
MDIKLNFINRSNDVLNSDVVIFQKNIATDAEELAVAWTVIHDCGQNDCHPFTWPQDFQVSAGDSWGNYTALQVAQAGQLFQMKRTTSGDQLLQDGPSTSQNEIQVLNALTQGSISANIYKSGRLIATKTAVVPGQKAVFEFRPTIWIGVVSQVTQGQVITSAVMSTVNTEISLLGIASADIVMTGGGAGAPPPPFSFSLENVVMA